MKIPDFDTLVFPKDLADKVREEGFWETEAYHPFFINVDWIESDAEDGAFLYSFQFNPNDEAFESLNKAIALKGFDENGYGWTQFLLGELQQRDKDLRQELGSDPEAETCYLASTSKQLFYRLLLCLKMIFQALEAG